MSKWFWIAIIALIVIAIVAFILFTYYQIIIDAITGLFQGIVDFFGNLF